MGLSGETWGRQFPDFDRDPRNIRFGLSTDGMNTLDEWGSSHSTWPVILCMFNLPSWLCMKRKYILMPALIQGPKQPGNDIDMYLRPLVDELLLFWKKEGVRMSTNKRMSTSEHCFSYQSMIGLHLAMCLCSQIRDTRLAPIV